MTRLYDIYEFTGRIVLLQSKLRTDFPPFLFKNSLSIEMDIQALSLAGAALVAGGSYINARYGIGTDIREISHEKNGVKRLLENCSRLGENCTIYNAFSRSNPTSDALWFEGQSWTYGQLKHGMASRDQIFIFANRTQEVDRLSSFLHEKGVKTGDFIAVFMSNSPEMVMAILALQKLGAVAALININLRGT